MHAGLVLENAVGALAPDLENDLLEASDLGCADRKGLARKPFCSAYLVSIR